MASFEKRPPSDLRHQQQEILDYVHEIVEELSIMSARAGLDRLSCDLRAAVLQARGSGDSSPERRISGLYG
jgi:hypothetical protein